jgi:hypothetical protein
MKGIITVFLFVLAATSAGAFVLVDSWYHPDIGLPGDFVQSDVTLDIGDVDPDADLKVVFTIPELGLRVSKGPYELPGSRYASVRRGFEIPYDAEPGEYVIRMYVTDDFGNKKIRHRFVEIE